MQRDYSSLDSQDYETGAPEGIAYMGFKDQESFNKAYGLNGSDLEGHTLTVDEAKPRPNNCDGGWSGVRDGAGRSKRQEILRKRRFGKPSPPSVIFLRAPLSPLLSCASDADPEQLPLQQHHLFNLGEDNEDSESSFVINKVFVLSALTALFRLASNPAQPSASEQPTPLLLLLPALMTSRVRPPAAALAAFSPVSTAATFQLL
ncbi:hypothetical protein ZIOFF_040803 [Zingiber officinale]|uniref:RRM domain-containing protein n=1 Tax=Zingiber officinale TaxID=94328 RepID=A0A8J5G6R8_ZINOF|nr:hypothetical protein ZIOFF_040803 [Zingiber officinale]